MFSKYFNISCIYINDPHRNPMATKRTLKENQ